MIAMKTRTILVTAAALMLSQGVFAQGAYAQELRVGISAEPSSADPHYHNLTPNNMLGRQVYEPLVGQDKNQALVPLLAESWTSSCARA
jgi:peptide/nickel transport system substrate-binding protein